MTRWLEVTPQNPCPICSHGSWCRLSADGVWVVCRRVDTGTGQLRQDKNGADFWLYRMDGNAGGSPDPWVMEKDVPCANEDTRNRVYRLLLGQLTLTPDHHAALVRRGLSEEEIRRNEYRTWPAQGRARITKTLLEQVDETTLHAIPGAYVRTEKDRSWWCLAGSPGLLVPIRNATGQIVALKVRADDDDPERAKYSYVSSRNYGGPSPSALIHVPLHDDAMETTTVRVTEGELKADVAQNRTGILTVSVPGVSNWRLVVPVLRSLNAEIVRIAFDADSCTNPNVARALQRTHEELTRQGWTVHVETWPAAWGKGIDDVLMGGYTPQIHTKPPAESQAKPEATIFEELAQRNDPGEVLIRRVLSEPETLGALALAAENNTAQWEGLLLRLLDTGAKLSTIASLKRSVKSMRPGRRGLRAVGPGERLAPSAIRNSVPDAPVPDNAVVPERWSISADGVFEAKQELNPTTGQVEVVLNRVAPVPIVVTGRLRNVADTTESVRIEWPRDGRWTHAIVRRGVMVNASHLVDLADHGLPVTTATAKKLAQFLLDFEATNIDVLPRAQVSESLGWQRGDPNSLAFLWGHTLLRPHATPVVSQDFSGVSPEEWDSGVIAFRGAGGGDDQIASAFTAQGSLNAWKSAVQSMVSYPRAMMAIYASLTAPCLTVLGAPNFIVDWSFTTSTGKTTALRIAASCWGNPDERDVASILGSWDVTRIWIERMSTILNGLPLMLDDTKRARSRDFVGKTLYDIASGHGRGRGSLRGMQRAGSWTTVLLSTGESPAVQFTQDGGTRGRTVTLWGGPFGVPTQETARVVTQLDASVRLNYGHAGPQFVQWLLDRHQDWEAWRVLYRKLVGVYQERSVANSMGVRLASYFAAMDTASQLVHQALDFSWDPAPILEAAWGAATEEIQEADRAAHALGVVVTWAELNPTTFWGRHADNNYVPTGGWSGKWDGNSDWTVIGIAPQRIQHILVDAGWDVGEVEGILRTWRDREWLDVDSDRKRYTKRMRIGGENPRLVAIRRTAIEALT